MKLIIDNSQEYLDWSEYDTKAILAVGIFSGLYQLLLICQGRYNPLFNDVISINAFILIFSAGFLLLQKRVKEIKYS